MSWTISAESLVLIYETEPNWTNCWLKVNWPLKLSIAHGIVCGMNYLHSLHEPVIHSDLKTENILISDTYVAKVSHFTVYKVRSYIIKCFVTHGLLKVVRIAIAVFNT